MTTHEVVDERLQAGRDAFDRYAWHEAHEALAAVAASGPLSREDLDRLAEAAWWTGRHAECVDARGRAYAAHLEAGNPRRAARVALDLMLNHVEREERSIAAGWLKRAIRLLEREPDCVEQGHLARALASRALNKGDLDEALAQSQRALDIGARYGDRDLQALALNVQGWALILKGEVDEGMSLLEEATAAAVGGELGPRATGTVYCIMIAVCHDLADYGRAGEWTDAAKRWCERQAISGFPGVCRVHHAEIMRLRGSWDEAEREARRAIDELMNFDVGAAASGLYEIGEIRLRIGDLDAAEEAFRQARELSPWPPEPGASLLRLRRGDMAAAAASIRRALDDEWDPLVWARYLPAQVEIALAAGDLDAARAGAEELESTAAKFGTDALQASAACARGALSLADRDADTAVRGLRRGLQLWHKLDLPYEAARARQLLASAYRLEGDEAAATQELKAAGAAFEKLGAVLDAHRCADLLREGDGSRPVRRAVRTFMFTDIVGSTTLIEAIGDSAWQDLRRWHDQTLRTCFAEHGGEEIDHAGDGFFIAFPDARSAIECAMEIQRKLADHRRTHGFAPQIRIGLHATEATQSGDQYTGKGVHAAARIGALAQGGEILASAGTLAGVDGLATAEPREVTLKGISEPVAVVSIDWR